MHGKHIVATVIKPGWSLSELLLRGSLLITVVASLLLLCGAVLAKRSFPEVVPFAAAALHRGTTSTSLEKLDPEFLPPVQRVLETLREKGFAPRVASTWRSRDRQEWIFWRGRLRQRVLGGAPATRARAGQSCHNAALRGAPAALAVDILPDKTRRTTEQKALFYRALGEAATNEGLLWGGSWTKKNRAWARFDLGWDPAHLQSVACSSRLRSRHGHTRRR